MGFIIDNFNAFANTYVSVLVNVYLILVAVIFAIWLKPFVVKQRTAYLTAFVYGMITVINNQTEVSRNIAAIITLGITVISFVILWLLDGRRNPMQKILLCVLFRLFSWLSIELFIEIGFFERDLVLGFDWYSYSMKAIVLEFIIWNLILYILPLILLFAVTKVIHKVYKRKSAEITWRELIILLTPVCSLLLVKPIVSSYYRLWMDGIANGSIKENIPANPFRILFSILSFFPVIITIVLYQELKEKQEEEYIRESVEKQVGDTYRYTAHVDELYEKMRAMRHDMGNHLAVIEGLAESGKNRELIDYIGEFRDRLSAFRPAVVSGNAVTDIVLSEISDECKNAGIGFESLFIYPEKLAINPFDMSVVLSNALNNAVEASEGLPDPRIVIKSVEKENTFLISIRNKCVNRAVLYEDGLIESTKKESGHGYGLKNIRSIAGKYRGDIEIRQEEKGGELFFILNVMMMG